MHVLPHIVVHELRVLYGTRRALIALSLYLGIAIVGAFGYVKMVQVGHERALALMMKRGASAEQARLAVDSGMDPLRRRVLEAVIVRDGGEISASLANSLILPVYFWCSLAFLPFLILLTSLDHIAVELADRSLTYRVLRAHRTEILLGKVAAHALVFAVLSGVSSLVLLLLAASMLESVPVFASLHGLLRIWVLLVPYAMCYLAIGTFASTASRQPFVALTIALGIATVLRLFGAIGNGVSEEGAWSFLRGLRYLSPSHYHDGLWLAGIERPLLSASAYAAFGLAFLALAIFTLGRRDL
jgi:ABC-2 type transport system permease protein